MSYVIYHSIYNNYFTQGHVKAQSHILGDNQYYRHSKRYLLLQHITVTRLLVTISSWSPDLASATQHNWGWFRARYSHWCIVFAHLPFTAAVTTPNWDWLVGHTSCLVRHYVRLCHFPTWWGLWWSSGIRYPTT